MTEGRCQINALGEFNLFPRLPPEIRRQIWIFTLPATPRLIPYPATMTPTISRVSHESRAAFLSIYTKSFIVKRKPPSATREVQFLSDPISLYANLSLDILYFDWDLCALFKDIDQSLSWLTTSAFENLNHVAVERNYWKRHTPRGSRFWNRGTRPLRCDIQQFERLEKLTFVNKRFICSWEMDPDNLYDEYNKVRNLDGRELMEIDEQHKDWDKHRKWLERYGPCGWWGEEKPEFLSAQIVSTDEAAIR